MAQKKGKVLQLVTPEMVKQAEAAIVEAARDAINKVNAAIDERTKYGTRLEKYYAKGTLLRWSNAGAKWHISPATHTISKPFIYDGYKVVQLDANEVLVDVPRRLVENMDKLNALHKLPLHVNSTESMYGR